MAPVVYETDNAPSRKVILRSGASSVIRIQRGKPVAKRIFLYLFQVLIGTSSQGSEIAADFGALA